MERRFLEEMKLKTHSESTKFIWHSARDCIYSVWFLSAIQGEFARVRATEVEGSLCTQKEHYGLQKMAARIKLTEILLIYFGIPTANAVNLARIDSVKVALAAWCPMRGTRFYGCGGSRREWNWKIVSETRTSDIKSDEFDRKIWESQPVNLDGMNLMIAPY